MNWRDRLTLLLGVASPFVAQQPAIAAPQSDAKAVADKPEAQRDVTYWRDPAQAKRLLQLAGHGSHRSHRSHSSHRSHYSGSGGYRAPRYTPPVYTPPRTPAPRTTTPRAVAPLYSPPATTYSTPTTTPFVSSGASTPSDRINGRAFSQSEIRQVVRRVQTALTVRGYDPGGLDGLLGDKTRTALRQYQAANGLPQSGYLDLATLDGLGVTVATPSLGAAPAPVAIAPLAPQAPAAVEPVPAEPVWLDQPTAADLDRLRPSGAPRQPLGSAVIRCMVAEDGTLFACFAESETLPGRRYGQSAVRAAALYRMRVDGAYAVFVGQAIEVRISWT
ncbi:His-Xaa-Ser repeat protein HxsA [Brevundimonas diminuta]|uniref:His-Xaa-Ser repeat protein HxsA n=1 Tax=Brevundimonas diminuta TaxID=293 RepID=UPI00320BAB83